MTIVSEQSLRNFEFWSGAKDNAEKLSTHQLDQIEDELTELYPDGISDTTLNDLFWFDFEWICSTIGLVYDPDTDAIIN